MPAEVDKLADVRDLAERLFVARERGVPIAPIRGELREKDIAAAYRIQVLNGARRIDAGARVVGRKIGLTSAAVQKQLGVDQPDFGLLFDDMAYRGNDVTIPRKVLIAPRIEAEIALILSRDITKPVKDIDEMATFVAAVAAAAEIVDSAIEGWNIGIVDTIADNASSRLFAIGEPQPFPTQADLAACTMSLTKNGEAKAAGSGAATLGHPLVALQWLANKAVEFEHPLQAGDIILSGALGPMIPFDPATYTIEITGFPTLTVRAVP
ncbi:MAG: fumarylacetoacetate hydrolase family protein [Alphaproteobacteria bacterium]|nr:fumarylacetoacetate hydrolase family protein [Alphaproteobacteria bacterium]MBL7097284.1 fumarylacetoacetate hydrolase family protein [Alphaproteobacteria bacterium]